LLAATALVAAAMNATGAGAQGLIDTALQGVPGLGDAQGVTVQSRIRPEFDPLGERVGGFLVHPSVALGAGYESDVVAKRGSWLGTIAPSVSFASDWSRNALAGSLSLVNTTYLDLPEQDRTDWAAALSGTVDVARGSLTLTAQHQSLHQTETQIGALPSDQPVAYRVDGALAQASIPSGRFAFEPQLAFTSYRYDQASIAGQTIDEQSNDRNVVQGGVTARYQLANLRSLLFVARAASTTFPQPLPGEPDLGATGASFLGGFDTVEGPWHARLLAGVGVRRFADPAIGSNTAPIVELDTIWSPNALTTLSAAIVHSNQDADIANVNTTRFSSARLGIDHEYLRNVIFGGHFRAERASFGAPEQTETQVGAGVGVSWLLNRSVRLEATYDVNLRTPPVAGTDRVSNIGLLRVRLAM
jgi:hypothetical protein